MSPDTVLFKDRLCHLQLSEYDATFKNTPIFPFTGIVGVFHNHGNSFPWDAHLNVNGRLQLNFYPDPSPSSSLRIFALW